MDDDEIIMGLNRYIEDQKYIKRTHASFFYAGRKYKGIAEEAIAEEFAPSFEKSYGVTVKKIVQGDDPPDIVFEADRGKRYGIELTELVNKAAITAKIKNDDALYSRELLNWNQQNTCERIESLLNAKQLAAENVSGLYERYIVLIHTDETMLTSNQVSRYVSGHTWPQYSNIDDAYIICSYEPGNDYPVIALFGT